MATVEHALDGLQTDRGGWYFFVNRTNSHVFVMGGDAGQLQAAGAQSAGDTDSPLAYGGVGDASRHAGGDFQWLLISST